MYSSDGKYGSIRQRRYLSAKRRKRIRNKVKNLSKYELYKFTFF